MLHHCYCYLFLPCTACTAILPCTACYCYLLLHWRERLRLIGERVLDLSRQTGEHAKDKTEKGMHDKAEMWRTNGMSIGRDAYKC